MLITKNTVTNLYFKFRYAIHMFHWITSIQEVLSTKIIEVGSQIYHREVLPYAKQGMKQSRCYRDFEICDISNFDKYDE